MFLWIGIQELRLSLKNILNLPFLNSEKTGKEITKYLKIFPCCVKHVTRKTVIYIMSQVLNVQFTPKSGFRISETLDWNWGSQNWWTGFTWRRFASSLRTRLKSREGWCGWGMGSYFSNSDVFFLYCTIFCLCEMKQYLLLWFYCSENDKIFETNRNQSCITNLGFFFYFLPLWASVEPSGTRMFFHFWAGVMVCLWFDDWRVETSGIRATVLQEETQVSGDICEETAPPSGSHHSDTAGSLHFFIRFSLF